MPLGHSTSGCIIESTASMSRALNAAYALRRSSRTSADVGWSYMFLRTWCPRGWFFTDRHSTCAPGSINMLNSLASSYSPRSWKRCSPKFDNAWICTLALPAGIMLYSGKGWLRLGSGPVRGACMVRAIFRYVVLLAILLVIGLVVFVAVTYPRFRADIQPNRERLLTGSDIVTTEEFGDIEYAVQGKGLPVLLVHGAGGGYDQGLLIGENYVGDGHRFIAPSRFGYVRSSIPENGSPAAQADAYAALLDTLGVERVAVVGFSDGGPSALQFALRYPERCAA